MIYTVRPLFKPDEYEEANKYLADKYFGLHSIFKTFIASMTMTGTSDLNDPYKLVQEIFRRTYGINSPQIANFIILQDFVTETLADTLLNYMKNVGVNMSIMNFVPSSISIPMMFKTGNLSPWDPNKKWNLFDEDTSELDHIYNPLNRFLHTHLILENTNNLSFLSALLRSGVIDSKEVESNPKKLYIKLLPCNNFNKVLNIANAIFRYY